MPLLQKTWSQSAYPWWNDGRLTDASKSSFARPVCPVYTQIHICLRCSVVLTMHANGNAHYLKYKMFKHFTRVLAGSESWEQSQAARWVWSSDSVPPEALLYPENPTKPQPARICLLSLYPQLTHSSFTWKTPFCPVHFMFFWPNFMLLWAIFWLVWLEVFLLSTSIAIVHYYHFISISNTIS